MSALDDRLGNIRLTLVVGSGGVGKTTLAAALGAAKAAAGERCLVMTFDPSLRLKDALGVDRVDRGEEIRVASADGELFASLLDARKTFDRLVERYSPDAASRERILNNRYYDHLAGHLGGILEYMAVERLYEVATEGRYDRVILDTPPTRQAIDFLEAPQRIVSFLDSGALRIALRPWFGDDGELKVTSGLGFVGRQLEGFLDRIVGMQLLRDMSEFFRAFEPMFGGFRSRAEKVEKLLGASQTSFILVAGPGRERIPDALFFARRLKEAGYRLGPIVVNRVHPEFALSEGAIPEEAAGRELFHWLGRRHQDGLADLRKLLPQNQALVAMPLEAGEPTDLGSLNAMGRRLLDKLAKAKISLDDFAAMQQSS